MAFDAGMMRAVVWEINRAAKDARVEKIQQPQKDEIVITLHSAAQRSDLRLSINAGANNPKLGFTAVAKENPAAAPMLCMLLRKQLGGGKLVQARQIGFDRVCELEFASRDEMGFAVTRYLIVEIMGKYSNLLLADENKKIITALHLVDFSTSRLRQILPGMTYELPPAQDKADLFTTDCPTLAAYLAAADASLPLHKFILGRFLGISPLVARELAFRATGRTDTPVGEVRTDALFAAFADFIRIFAENDYVPTLVYGEDDTPVEFCFTELRQYGAGAKTERFPTFGALLDAYFGKRDLAEKIKQRGQDIIHLLSHANARLERKLDVQREELAACDEGETYRLYGDLITANLYQLKRGAETAALPNYYSENCETVIVPLDTRLTPAQNAQRYYKKYNKIKNARVVLTEQIALSEAELRYLATVAAALERAETESDLAEIRHELAVSGYGSRMRGYKPGKNAPVKPMEFRTSGGYRVLCGKNNMQNEFVTFRAAGKLDLWFHVKGCPGSHVVLICDGEEPPERDYTEAATIAATYSKAADGGLVPVDYTRVKNVKKPPASKPGYVPYSTNYTAYVARDEKLCERLRVK